MKGINIYWQELSAAEIEAGKHREMVGGLWDELGLLQLDFMRQQGLRPDHALLDIGCGSLRGGVRFIRYLDAGRYHGLDINPTLIEGGRVELAKLGLTEKHPQLLVNSAFEFSRFGVQFDYAIAVSVFTHLFMNHIGRCLVEIGRVLKPEGRFYATVFSAPHSAYLQPLTHKPGDVTTYYDADPFHYSCEELATLARTAGLILEPIGDWNHPRGQQMICLRRA